jgi:hypothetical protein
MLARIAVAAMLAGSLVALIPGSAHADYLTERRCDVMVSGDYVRKLDVCARGWVGSPFGYVTRGVVEMHTYKWLANIGWVDSTSQSITLETAFNSLAYPYWGQSETAKCRINGPGGNVGCSVPNTSRVAFYGPAMDSTHSGTFTTTVLVVSWRDDRGVPHPKREFIPYLSSFQWEV